ncbi:WD repeat-containing protein 18 isoform X2 [Oratosquilla oratoria]|uniref:WD repeat-containing protein 18 isoform X2 n=1 Tax=Oratosquilla oratoria TaxID=337810 RepID=UPI003F75CB84
MCQTSPAMEPLVDALLVSALNSNTEAIQVYDVKTGTNLHSFKGTPASSSTLNFVGACDYVMTAQKDKPLLQAWIINRHDPLHLRLVVPGRVKTMAVSPSGPKYCVVAVGEKMYVYKLLYGHLIAVISCHYQPITCIQFTLCGNYFVSGGEDGFVYLWSMAQLVNNFHTEDAPEIQPWRVLGQHSDKVTSISMSVSGLQGLLFSSSLDRTVKVYDLLHGNHLHTLLTDQGITRVTCNSIGSQIFLGLANGKVSVVNLLPHLPIGDIEVSDKGCQCHEKAVRHIVVSPSGNTIVTGGDDEEVKVWALSGNAKPQLSFLRTVHTGRGAITNLALLAIDRQIFEGDELKPTEIIAPFSTDTTEIQTCSVTVPIRGRPSSLQDSSSTFHPITDNVIRTSGSHEKNGSPKEANNDNLVEQLKVTNSELYHFALKQLLDLDEEYNKYQ